MKPVRLPTVEEIAGEPGCFWVQSASRPGIRHRVDMLAFRGNGACGCERFEFEVAPILNRLADPSPMLECRHIRIVRHLTGMRLWVDAFAKMKAAEKVRRDEAKRKAEGSVAATPGARVYDLRASSTVGASRFRQAHLGPPPVREKA